MRFVLDFFRLDPLVAWTLTGGLGTAGVILVVFVLWSRHVDQQARDRQFESRMQAALGPVPYPPKPLGAHSQPWRKTRRSA